MRDIINLVALVFGLTTTFIGAKIAGIIMWSWLWVFSPIWTSILVACASFLLLCIAVERTE